MRWPRIRVRTLLGGVLLIGVALGAESMRRRRVECLQKARLLATAAAANRKKASYHDDFFHVIYAHAGNSKLLRPPKPPKDEELPPEFRNDPPLSELAASAAKTAARYLERADHDD